MRAKHARQIRFGIEAALSGERSAAGTRSSLERRAFKRTVDNAESRKSQRRWTDLIEESKRHQRDIQASLVRLQDAINQHENAKARRLFQQSLSDQEVLDLEYQMNYPHPTMNDSMSLESIEHIATCLFCRRSHFSWMFDEAT